MSKDQKTSLHQTNSFERENILIKAVFTNAELFCSLKFIMEIFILVQLVDLTILIIKQLINFVERDHKGILFFQETWNISSFFLLLSPTSFCFFLVDGSPYYQLFPSTSRYLDCMFPEPQSLTSRGAIIAGAYLKGASYIHNELGLLNTSKAWHGCQMAMPLGMLPDMI